MHPRISTTWAPKPFPSHRSRMFQTWRKRHNPQDLLHGTWCFFPPTNPENSSQEEATEEEKWGEWPLWHNFLEVKSFHFFWGAITLARTNNCKYAMDRYRICTWSTFRPEELRRWVIHLLIMLPLKIEFLVVYNPFKLTHLGFSMISWQYTMLCHYVLFLSILVAKSTF